MRLYDLHQFLEDAQVARPEQLKAELESGEPQGSFKATGNGLLVFRHRYQGRIGLEKGAADLGHLLALVHVWMQENVEDDEQGEFLGWIGEPVSDRISDIDLQFRFEEELHYEPAPGYGGKDGITFRGVDYKPVAEAVDRATAVDGVQAEVTTP